MKINNKIKDIYLWILDKLGVRCDKCEWLVDGHHCEKLNYFVIRKDNNNICKKFKFKFNFNDGCRNIN